MKQSYKIKQEDLNLDNIQIGDVFVGQTALCKALGIKPKKSGDSKKAQEEQLKQYIAFEKINQKTLKITDIYTTPIIKVDNRGKGNNMVYREDFLVILAKTLLKMDKNDEPMLFSRGKLAEHLCLINPNYRLGRLNVEKLSEKYKIPVENILDFYSINNTKIAKNIETTMLHYENENYFSINRNIAVCTRNKHRMATPEERELIETCKAKVQEEMNFKTVEEIYFKNMWYVYNERVVNEIQKHNSNIKYYYRAYEFTYINRTKLQKVYDDMKARKTTVTKTKQELNERYKESSIKSAEKRQNNATKKLNDKKINKFRMQKYLLLTSEKFFKFNCKLVVNLISYKAVKLKLKDLNKDLEELNPQDLDDLCTSIEDSLFPTDESGLFESLEDEDINDYYDSHEYLEYLECIEMMTK